MKSAAADVLFAVLGFEITLATVFFCASGFTAGALALAGAFTTGAGSLWKVATGLTTVLTGAFWTVFTKVFIVVDLAGVMATAEAQIVTLPPLTCEPTLLDPDEPPEFLQLAKLG